jgi:hypothetical protein
MGTALARVSTRDKGQDCQNQLIQLREFARTQGARTRFEGAVDTLYDLVVASRHLRV